MLNAVIHDITNMSINTHANHVIQHILEYFPYETVLPIIKHLETSLPFLSSEKYGCYVLQVWTFSNILKSVESLFCLSTWREIHFCEYGMPSTIREHPSSYYPQL